MNFTIDYIRAISELLNGNSLALDVFGADTDGDFYASNSEENEEFNCDENNELPF